MAETLLSLRQIRYQVEKRAPIVGAEPGDLPTYGTSRDFGYPHIEVDESAYHWVVVERGQVRDRSTFSDLDDLLFAVFVSTTFSIASRWELANRVPHQDSRRLLFQRQIELLSTLDPTWGDRQRRQIEAVIREYPFRDELRPRGGPGS